MTKKELAFGLIGLGHFGKHYLRLLAKQTGVHLSAIADRSPDAFRKHNVDIPPETHRLSDAKELLRSPDIDCVIIATPAQSHFRIASEALKLGKHVFLEKPMTMGLKEAYTLKGIVEKSKKTFLLGHQYLYNDYLHHLKRKLTANILGKIKYVVSENFQYGPIRKEISCFWETATHELSILDYLLGPLEVYDVRGRASSVMRTKYDDFSAVEVVLQNKILVTIVVSWFMPQKVRRMTIVGTKGMTLFDDCEVQNKLKFILTSYPKTISGSSHFFDQSKQKILVPRIIAQEPLRNELIHFIDCVRNNKKPLTDIEHGIRITSLLDHISESLDLK